MFRCYTVSSDEMVSSVLTSQRSAA